MTFLKYDDKKQGRQRSSHLQSEYVFGVLQGRIHDPIRVRKIADGLAKLFPSRFLQLHLFAVNLKIQMCRYLHQSFLWCFL